jgi:hypothetical protein
LPPLELVVVVVMVFNATFNNISFGIINSLTNYNIKLFYELSAVNVNNKMDQFSKYEGKVTLVVNMASCDKNTKKELLQV